MSPGRFKKSIPEVKPFRLAKYFAITSFILLIIISIPFAVFISQKAKDELFEDYQAYAQEVGGNIDRQLFVNFMVPMISEYRTIKLSMKPQMEALDRAVKKATESLNVDIINLYSLDEGFIIYSTDSSLIRKKTVKTEGYLKALKGEISTELLSEENDLWGLGIEGIGGWKKVRTFIPLKSPYGEVTGIFEMVLDMTEKYNSILKRQYTTFGVFAVIIFIIFFTMLMFVRKAESIIESRAIEQRKLVEQLNLAERLAALGEMVAGVSHEIKNPLGIIQSTSELLNNMPNADETQKRLSGVITEESIRLNRIVTEFLDFARPHELNILEFDLKEIINKNIEFLMPEIHKKGVVVDSGLDGRSFMIEADKDLLHRVFMNLIINAIQATPEYGRIFIDIEEKKGAYRIIIKDTGSGISDQNISKIFNPFFTTKERGSGLGLPIVRKIIEGHGGTIDIESAEGAGTRVILHLPRKI
ncbi:MAG: GHKL domain-containing protein [Deltaproteobacteria bacterium]|nr:GHKL domain-containing protein [Deltaproteobacteria bacterium]